MKTIIEEEVYTPEQLFIVNGENNNLVNKVLSRDYYDWVSGGTHRIERIASNQIKTRYKKSVESGLNPVFILFDDMSEWIDDINALPPSVNIILWDDDTYRAACFIENPDEHLYDYWLDLFLNDKKKKHSPVDLEWPTDKNLACEVRESFSSWLKRLPKCDLDELKDEAVSIDFNDLEHEFIDGAYTLILKHKRWPELFLQICYSQDASNMGWKWNGPLIGEPSLLKNEKLIKLDSSKDALEIYKMYKAKSVENQVTGIFNKVAVWLSSQYYKAGLTFQGESVDEKESTEKQTCSYKTEGDYIVITITGEMKEQLSLASFKENDLEGHLAIRTLLNNELVSHQFELLTIGNDEDLIEIEILSDSLTEEMLSSETVSVDYGITEGKLCLKCSVTYY